MRSRKIEHLEDAFLPFEATRVKARQESEDENEEEDNEGLNPLILFDAAYDPQNAMEYGILRHHGDDL